MKNWYKYAYRIEHRALKSFVLENWSPLFHKVEILFQASMPYKQDAEEVGDWQKAVRTSAFRRQIDYLRCAPGGAHHEL